MTEEQATEEHVLDTVIPLIKLLEAVAELASLEGFDSITSKLEEAVEDLATTLKESHALHPTSPQQFLL